MALGTAQTTGGNNAPKGGDVNGFNLGTPVGKYASLGDLASILAPDVRKDMVKTFGNQGISGLLENVNSYIFDWKAMAEKKTLFYRLHQSGAIG